MSILRGLKCQSSEDLTSTDASETLKEARRWLDIEVIQEECLSKTSSVSRERAICDNPRFLFRIDGSQTMMPLTQSECEHTVRATIPHRRSFFLSVRARIVGPKVDILRATGTTCKGKTCKGEFVHFVAHYKKLEVMANFMFQWRNN